MGEKHNTTIRTRIFSMRDNLVDRIYSAKELAELFGVSSKYIRQNMIALSGAPAFQDMDSNRIRISGLKLKLWIEANYEPIIKKDSTKQAVHKGNNIGQSRIIKLGVYHKRNKLLNMQYTISDLAFELGIDSDYIRYKMIQRQGAPVHLDANNHLWVYGLELKSWIEDNYSPDKLKPEKRPMEVNEFYCVKCRERRKTDSFTTEVENHTRCQKTVCPVCGTKMYKFISKEMNHD